MAPHTCGHTKFQKNSGAVLKPKDPLAQDDLTDLMGRILLTLGLCNMSFPTVLKATL